DMYKPLDVALFSRNEDGSLSELRYSFKGRGKRIHTSGNPILDSGEYSPDHHAPIDLSEDAHFFHLGSNARGRVYCAKVKYLKLPIDAYGNPMVPEHQVLAIALFTRYMWTFANSTGEDRK